MGEATGTAATKGTGTTGQGAPGGQETPGERANRELIELLTELRVVLPGVQVLFAFLLTVPFTQRFGQLDSSDRRVFYAAVLLTAAATLCLIAPSVHHRLRFRGNIKEHLLKTANVFAVMGMVLLALAISAVTYLITKMVYPGDLPKFVTTALVLGFTAVWFGLPFLYRPTPTPPHEEPDGADGADGAGKADRAGAADSRT